MRRALHRHLSYANVVSLVAILAATGGTAWAAAKVSGSQIKDSSLTGADFRNGTLEAADVSESSRKLMRGRRGPAGDRGPTGATGPQGATGNAGKAGGSAHSLVRYATRASELLRANLASAAPNASSPTDWDDASYASYGDGDSNNPFSSAGTHPNLTEDFASTSVRSVAITQDEPVLVQLTGNNQDTTGTIRPTSAGLLTATATLTIMHTSHAEADWEGGRALHSRVRCALRYANNGQAVGSGSPKLGAAEWLSSRAQHKLYTITLTGSEKITANTLANYNVGVSCADVDRTGSNQWTFVSGSITAHSVFIES